MEGISETEIGPGLYSDIPSDTYFQLPGVSQSQLKIMRDRSPFHLKYALDHPEAPEESDSMALGSALHDACLLPVVFADQYMTAGPCEGVTAKGAPCSNAGKDRFGGKWYCGTHSPKDKERDGGVVLSSKEHEQCMGMQASVAADPSASLLLEYERKELTAIWRDEETGLLCRGRFDLLSDDGEVVADLKTCRSAARTDFERSAFGYGYHLQSQHYLNGARALGLDAQIMAFIAVESVAPWAVCTYQVASEALDAGQKELRLLMRQYAECAENGAWPGYRSPTVLTLPGYAWKQIEERADDAE